MKIWEMPVSVLVWTMQGCPGCASYEPVLRGVAEGFGSIPTIIADVNQFGSAADAYGVVATPTTLLLRYGRPVVRKLEGPQDADTVSRLYQIGMSVLGGYPL